MPIFSTNTKIWLHGIFAAFISTFATSAAGFIVLPTVFNFTHDGLMNMVKLSTIPAMVNVFAYLQKSPLPDLIGPGDTATVKDPVISSDGSISGSSATLTKAAAPTTPSATIKQ